MPKITIQGMANRFMLGERDLFEKIWLWLEYELVCAHG